MIKYFLYFAALLGCTLAAPAAEIITASNLQPCDSRLYSCVFTIEIMPGASGIAEVCALNDKNEIIWNHRKSWKNETTTPQREIINVALAADWQTKRMEGRLIILNGKAQLLDSKLSAYLPENDEAASRPQQELWMNVDYYDLAYFADRMGYENYTEREIVALFEKLQEQNVTGVLWRISLLGQVLYRSKVCTVVPGDYPYEKLSPEMRRAADAMRECDPLAIAVREAKNKGIQLYIWVTVNDEAGIGDDGPFWSEFARKHPECAFVDREGKPQWGSLCYWMDAALDYRLKQLDELIAYGADGVFYCFRRHALVSDSKDSALEYGFNPPIVEEYQKRYGRNLLTEPFDGNLFLDLKAEGYDRLIGAAAEKLHRAGQKLQIGITSPFDKYLRSHHGMTRVNWPLWLKQRWVDSILVGVWQQTPAEIFSGMQALDAIRYPDQKVYFWIQMTDYSTNHYYRQSTIFEQIKSAAAAGANGVSIHEMMDYEQNFDSRWKPTTELYQTLNHPKAE